MPAFAFKGVDSRGKRVNGVREADSARGLRLVLRQEGIFLMESGEVHEKIEASKEGLAQKLSIRRWLDRVRPEDVANMTRQLATLLRAGVPLTECLSALLEQSEADKLGRVLAEVRTQVNEGTSLGDALAQHNKVFSDLYVNMVRAGETAGNLEQVLARLAEFLDNQAKLSGRVRSAMMYPMIMAGVGVLLTGMLMVVVVPKVTQIFADVGKALPWYTQVLIAVSEFTGRFWWLILVVLIFGWRAFGRWRRGEKGRLKWHRFLLRMWVVGPLVRMVAIARFGRTLGTMLSSGVPLLQSLEIVKAILGNQVLVEVVEKARFAIREGDSIADPLARSGEFPPVVTRMIAVGERSGQLESMLETVADAYDGEVELKLARLTSLMEPVMILLMGGIIGFIVFAILMPILQMNELIG